MSQAESHGSSVMEQAQETVEEKAGEVKEKAGELRSEASGRVREQVDTRSTQAGEQVSSVAEALRRTSQQLREEGKEQPAKVLEQGAERAERLGGYLQRLDSDSLLRELEGFGRRRPWIAAAGAALIGFAASRFLRASSERRYQSALGEGRGAYGGDVFGDVPYRRVPSPGAAAYEDTGGEERWRGPDADLADEVRESTSGQRS